MVGAVGAPAVLALAEVVVEGLRRLLDLDAEGAEAEDARVLFGLEKKDNYSSLTLSLCFSLLKSR